MTGNTNSDRPKTADNPKHLYQKLGLITITEAGCQYLKPLVTDTRSDIFALTGRLDPEQAAASYARLSRSSNGIRELLVSEFAEIDVIDSSQNDYKNKLLQRVISGCGDDSVQRLAGIYIVVEGDSNLLTKEIE